MKTAPLPPGPAGAVLAARAAEIAPDAESPDEYEEALRAALAEPAPDVDELDEGEVARLARRLYNPPDDEPLEGDALAAAEQAAREQLAGRAHKARASREDRAELVAQGQRAAEELAAKIVLSEIAELGLEGGDASAYFERRWRRLTRGISNYSA